jgi:hypothetical protein
VLARGVANGLGGVEPEAVEVKLVDPVARVGGEVLPAEVAEKSATGITSTTVIPARASSGTAPRWRRSGGTPAVVKKMPMLVNDLTLARDAPAA